MTLIGIVTASLAAGALAAQDAPPSPAADAGGLPRQYQVLLSRSIFAAGGKPETSAAEPPAASPESCLSLKGVVQDDQRFTAFVEDVPHKQVLELKVGDTVARGHIVAITLHELEYEAGGKLTRVAIGQPLSGDVAPTTQPADASAPTMVSAPQQKHRSAVAEAR